MSSFSCPTICGQLWFFPFEKDSSFISVRNVSDKHFYTTPVAFCDCPSTCSVLDIFSLKYSSIHSFQQGLYCTVVSGGMCHSKQIYTNIQQNQYLYQQQKENRCILKGCEFSDFCILQLFYSIFFNVVVLYKEFYLNSGIHLCIFESLNM